MRIGEAADHPVGKTDRMVYLVRTPFIYIVSTINNPLFRCKSGNLTMPEVLQVRKTAFFQYYL